MPTRYSKVIRGKDALQKEIESEPCLQQAMVQGVDFRTIDVDWHNTPCEGAVFLGCDFPESIKAEWLMTKGAMIFPRLHGVPYRPFRSKLYTRDELMAGWTAEKDLSYDKQIYDHYHSARQARPSMLEALAQRIHDHAVDEALLDLLEGKTEPGGVKKVVGIMGGHGKSRTDPFFKKVVWIARELTRRGYFIASGGGPGIMEAANLGAWLANAPDELLDQSLAILGQAPIFTSDGYMDRAYEVLELHPDGASSLAVPTWFYGHEPTNMFSKHVAKYFSNSIREDGLLAIALHGVIYAPGSAGTTQEIFMDATQNHYGTFDWISPMIFLGTQRYCVETMLYPCLKQLAQGRTYSDMLLCSDSESEIAQFVCDHPPVKGELK